MNNHIAKEGQYVIYTGNTSHALDDNGVTKRLMNELLIPGKIYRVDGIRKWGIYKGYYIIGNIYYPSKSFTMDKRNMMIIKYNLR